MSKKTIPATQRVFTKKLVPRAKVRTHRLKRDKKRLEHEVMERTLAEAQLQQSEEQFRLLIRNVKEYAIFVLSPEGKILSWNEGAERIFGYTAQEIVGKSGAMLLTIDDQKKKRFKTELTRALKKEHNEEEKWFLRKDGSTFWGNGAISTIRKKNGHLINLVKIVHDMTDFQKREFQKNEFISIASHEFRTPLTSLKAYTEYLTQRFRKANDAKSVDLMVKMEMQLEKLILLIRDLLDFTRIEAGKLPYHEGNFSLNSLISEVREEIQRITDYHIEIRLDDDIVIYGDRERISQVLTNFLSNAITHSHTTKIIMHTIRDTQSITVAVQDFGIGLPKHVLPRVFDRYFRGDETTPGTHGMGLGLYISSEIIKRHHGKIWVKSSKGKGSTFGFTLPISSK